jgi:hypothetical protein
MKKETILGLKNLNVDLLVLHYSGGGDYREDNDYVGAWSRNRIALMKEPPAGYTEITPNFIE